VESKRGTIISQVEVETPAADRDMQPEIFACHRINVEIVGSKNWSRVSHTKIGTRDIMRKSWWRTAAHEIQAAQTIVTLTVRGIDVRNNSFRATIEAGGRPERDCCLVDSA
jgi:hypothetical protein